MFLSGMFSIWNVFYLACFLSGMFSIWNVFYLEWFLSGMVSIWNGFYLECFLSKMEKFQIISLKKLWLKNQTKYYRRKQL